MNATPELRLSTFGLFDKRIEGDDCLLELAQLRFKECGMGAEFYAATTEQLDWLLKFRPAPVSMVHLARDLNLADAASRGRVVEFASRHAGDIRGLILHDNLDMASRLQDHIAAAHDLNARMEASQNGPILFIEYAAGLEPDDFVKFFEAIGSLKRISACIDVGHVGIRQIRAAYARLPAGDDICALKGKESEMSGAIEDVQSSIEYALPAVLGLIQILGAIGKPVHFHLHDGHPLSNCSPFGVSDHLSFLTEIPLGFEYLGRRSVPPMFGPSGLDRIISTSAKCVARASFTLEIHPCFHRRPLGDVAPRFAHWRDKTNAEQMNHWLWTLAQNHALLLALLERHAADPLVP